MLRFTLESGYVNDNFTTAHNPYTKHVSQMDKEASHNSMEAWYIPAWFPGVVAGSAPVFQGSLREWRHEPLLILMSLPGIWTRQMKLVFKDRYNLCYRGGIEDWSGPCQAGQNANYYELTVGKWTGGY